MSMKYTKIYKYGVFSNFLAWSLAICWDFFGRLEILGDLTYSCLHCRGHELGSYTACEHCNQESRFPQFFSLFDVRNLVLKMVFLNLRKREATSRIDWH